jgi:hypothetical protein
MKALKILAMLAIGAAILMTGCAGARTLVKADQAKYDVSLSGSLRDASGKLLTPDKLEVVGTYKQRGTGWGLIWSWVSLNSINLSKSINEQVEKAGGNGITDLTVDVQGGVLNFVPLFDWLPIWPGYNVADFTGKIVKIKAEEPPPPPVVKEEPPPPPVMAPAPASLNEAPAEPTSPPAKKAPPKKKRK